MSSIYTKRDWYYYQRYWDNPETGKREKAHFSLKTQDEAEAKQKQEKWDDHYDKKENGETAPETTWEEGRKRYIRHREAKVRSGELSERTLKSDKNALRRFEDWIEENDIDPYIFSVEDNVRNLRSFKYDRLEDVSLATIRNNLRHLSGFFSWLQSRQEVEGSPFSDVDIPQPNSDLEIPSADGWEEIKKEIRFRVEESDDPFWVALWIQARTGMRIGEVVRLTWEKAFTNQQRYAYITEANQRATVRFKGSLRNVPLGHVWNEIQTLERSANSPYVFESPNHAKTSHVRSDTWSGRAGKFLTEIGYPEATSHTLRHCFITELVRSDYSYKKIGDMVGHSVNQITERYSHLTTEDLADMMNEIDG